MAKQYYDGPVPCQGCGYITFDLAAADKEVAEIEAQYEALKPADGDAARTDAQSDNADDNEQ